MKLVSIIMPCYNSQETIAQSIKSVVDQKYENWELIVVDDCSVDATSEIVKNMLNNDPRIKYFCLERNSGSPAMPRNLGLDVSSGQYIAFLDSDDTWHPDKLFEQINFMESQSISFSCTSYEVRQNEREAYTYNPPFFVDYDMLLYNNSIGCLTCIIKRELVLDERFPVIGHEDFAMWLKLIKKVDGVYCLHKKLAIYNKVHNSVSSNKMKLIPFFWNIYKNQEGFSRIRSLYCCLRYLINVTWYKYK